MSTGPSGGAAVGGAPSFVVGPFAGPVVYRNVRAIGGPPLWQPSRPGLRWNPTLPAPYPPPALEPSLAHRLNHTQPISLEAVVAVAPVVAQPVADLTQSPTLHDF